MATPLAQKIEILYTQEPHPDLHKRQMESGVTPPSYWYASGQINGQEYNLFLGNQFREVSPQEIVHSFSHNPQGEKPDCSFEEVNRSHSYSDIRGTLEKEISDGKQDSPSACASEKSSTTFSFSSTDSIHPTSRKNGIPVPSRKEFNQDLKQFKVARKKEVKSKYRQLIKKYHPDLFGIEHPEMEEWMKTINLIHDSHLRRMQRAR